MNCDRISGMLPPAKDTKEKGIVVSMMKSSILSHAAVLALESLKQKQRNKKNGIKKR